MLDCDSVGEAGSETQSESPNELGSDADLFLTLTTLKSQLSSALQVAGDPVLPHLLADFMGLFQAICQRNCPESQFYAQYPREFDPNLHCLCAQVVRAAGEASQEFVSLMMKHKVFYCLADNLLYSRASQPPDFAIIIATLVALEPFLERRAAEVGEAVGLCSIMEAIQVPGFPQSQVRLGLRIVRQITVSYAPVDFYQKIPALLTFYESFTEPRSKRHTKRQAASAMAPTVKQIALDVVETLMTRADLCNIDETTVDRIVRLFMATKSGRELLQLSSCLTRLASFSAATPLILGRFLGMDSPDAPSLQFSLGQIIDPEVPLLPNDIPRDVFQERLLLMVSRLLPWSDVLGRFFVRLREPDPECCSQFASCIRAPLLAVLPLIRPTDTKALKQGLVALAAAYANSKRRPSQVDQTVVDAGAMDSADARPGSDRKAAVRGTARVQCSSEVQETSETSRESDLELTPALFAILKSAAQVGHHREVLSVLGRCTPESLRGCGSILHLPRNERREAWFRALYEEVKENASQPSGHSLVPKELLHFIYTVNFIEIYLTGNVIHHNLDQDCQ
jgi:hypothetical protein